MNKPKNAMRFINSSKNKLNNKKKLAFQANIKCNLTVS